MGKEKKIWKWIFLFFAGMLVCTVLSRAADSVTIPKVKVEKIKRGALKFVLEGEGNVMAEREEVLFLPIDAKPVQLMEIGTEVKQGDILAVFDMESLKEKKETYEAEKRKLELSMQEQVIHGNAATPATQGEKAEQTVNQLSEELNAIVAELERRQEEYRQKTEDEEELSEEEKQSLEAGIQECENQKGSLEQSLAEAQNALAEARESDANAEAENQRQRRLAELSKEGIRVDMGQKEKEIKKLEELIRAGGKMTASCDGTITEVTAVLGTVTSGQEYFKIGNGNEKFRAELDEEEALGLKENDPVVIIETEKKEEIKGKITEIRKLSNGQETQESEESQKAKVEIVVKLNKNELVVGSRMHFKVDKESKEYKALIPLEAIREDGTGKYVLILEERSSILGKEKKAARVNIEVKEQNEVNAAVESALMEEDEIIVGSNKAIKAGDRVRKE
ncbi:MAG: hypothetical protein HFI37_02805 [Lachnospiraceae bacterium]|nr:hypothetical protein [Lachnospiraceae bacterium]